MPALFGASSSGAQGVGRRSIPRDYASSTSMSARVRTLAAVVIATFLAGCTPSAATSTPTASPTALPTNAPSTQPSRGPGPSSPSRFAGRIAFSGSRDASVGVIYVIDGRDGSINRLTGDDVYLSDRPSWSPDGRSIAFAVISCQTDPCLNLIATLDVGTGEIREVARSTSEAKYSGPSWSPNGERLVFWSARTAASDPFRIDLMTMKVDGSELARIPIDLPWAARPAWSPDGLWIAFEGSDDAGATGLYVVHPDGSDLRSVTVENGSVGRPAWSPDGATLAYTSNGEPIEVAPSQFESLLEIRVVRLDGSGKQSLNAAPDQGSGPTWSPDGALLAYTGSRREADRIWLMAADGSDPHPLYSDESLIGSYPDWTATTGD